MIILFLNQVYVSLSKIIFGYDQEKKRGCLFISEKELDLLSIGRV
jgi:hypothetical protein